MAEHIQQPNEKKTNMTDKERLELSQRLDQELDEFIAGLEQRRYTEGWPEDRWEEEMEKHPFFMKSNPNGAMSGLAEGLAILKYDPAENTPLELADNYRTDGNFNYKHKNYRLAILGYTEGIKVKCDNAEMNASLYNNRAAAHWFLENIRSAYNDSQKALTFNPNHHKARMRAAVCALKLNKFQDCLRLCETIFATCPNSDGASTIYKEAKLKQLIFDRDQRKLTRNQARIQLLNEQLFRAINEREIRIYREDPDEPLNMSMLEPNLFQARDSVVFLSNNILHWPVLLLYPEVQDTDLIKDCSEFQPFHSLFENLFPAEWDEFNIYNRHSVNVYYVGYDYQPHRIRTDWLLYDILLMNYFEVKNGMPRFYVVPRDSEIEATFLGGFT